MGLLTALLTAPLAPVRGVVWIADQVLAEAERQYYDPGSIRRQLEQIRSLHEREEISDADATELEETLIARLLEGNARRGGVGR